MKRIAFAIALLCAPLSLAQAQVSTPPMRILDEGSALTLRFKLNFIGAGVSCVDNSSSKRTDCTISAGGGGTVTADSPLTGDGSSGSHLACPTCALTTTTISAGTGLSGGGSLAANRTLSMPNTGPGAGANTFSTGDSVTLDAQGRVTAVTPVTRTLNTTSPLGGGGTLAADRTLTCTTCVTGSPSATGDLLYSTSGGQGQTALADVAAGSYLRSGGVAGAPLWSTLTLPNAGTTGDLFYASSSNVMGRLAVGTAAQVLHGGASVPAFSAIVDGDLPAASNAAAIALKANAASPALTGTVAVDSNAGVRNNSGSLVLIASGADAVQCSSTACIPFSRYGKTLGQASFEWGALDVRHIKGSTASVPTIAAGTGAGTTPGTLSVAGSDLSMLVTVPTGTTPSGSNAIIATITFNTAYLAAPTAVVLVPAEPNAALLTGATGVYVDSASTTTTVFVIKSGSSGLTASTTYKWMAHVLQ